MSAEGDPLVLLPVERWSELLNVFKSDMPLGVADTFLETQKECIRNGFDMAFKVFCPFGDVRNGFVAFENDKEQSSELVIQCPQDTKEKLKDALQRTKIIDWQKPIVITIAQYHVIEGLQRALRDRVEVNVQPSELLIFDKPVTTEDIQLPPGITFGLVTLEYLDLIDSTWPLRHATSRQIFQMLINLKFGYGLFKANELIAWVFFNEYGLLRHLFTVENYRRKGYGELVLKAICNVSNKNGKPVLALCFKDNVNARKLYDKFGFRSLHPVARCLLNKKQ